MFASLPPLFDRHHGRLTEKPTVGSHNHQARQDQHGVDELTPRRIRFNDLRFAGVFDFLKQSVGNIHCRISATISLAPASQDVANRRTDRIGSWFQRFLGEAGYISNLIWLPGVDAKRLLFADRELLVILADRNCRL